MVEETPFHHFFATLGQGSPLHVDDVNAQATARLEQALKSPVDGPGRGILVRAPRAGYGKTHLIARVQHRLSSSHEFLPLTLLDGARLDATVAVESALRRLTRQLPAGGGLTALDLQARRILALSLQPLVASGEVPCQDREAALAALRQRPVETFDFHQPQAVTAQWTRENFEILGPRLALELSRLTGCSLNETSFWLAAIFRFSVAVPDHPGRTGMIIQSATSASGVERFAALIALLTLIARVVLVGDDLEGLHADPGGALRLGSFLAAVRQDAPRADAVLSINDDIWSSSFQPALSGGLQDRLSEIEIRLGPLDDEGIVSMLNERMPGRGADLLARLHLHPEDRYARKVLRLAAEQVPNLPLPGADRLPSPAFVAAMPEAAAPVSQPAFHPEAAIAAAASSEAPSHAHGHDHADSHSHHGHEHPHFEAAPVFVPEEPDIAEPSEPAARPLEADIFAPAAEPEAPVIASTPSPQKESDFSPVLAAAPEESLPAAEAAGSPFTPVREEEAPARESLPLPFTAAPAETETVSGPPIQEAQPAAPHRDEPVITAETALASPFSAFQAAPAPLEEEKPAAAAPQSGASSTVSATVYVPVGGGSHSPFTAVSSSPESGRSGSAASPAPAAASAAPEPEPVIPAASPFTAVPSSVPAVTPSPAGSVFQAAPSEETKPAPSQSAAPVATAPVEEPASSGGDRIDDLLRQFRDRYGRD